MTATTRSPAPHRSRRLARLTAAGLALALLFTAAGKAAAQYPGTNPYTYRQQQLQFQRLMQLQHQLQLRNAYQHQLLLQRLTLLARQRRAALGDGAQRQTPTPRLPATPIQGMPLPPMDFESLIGYRYWR